LLKFAAIHNIILEKRGETSEACPSLLMRAGGWWRAARGGTAAGRRPALDLLSSRHEDCKHLHSNELRGIHHGVPVLGSLQKELRWIEAADRDAMNP
jgi:hypothetical protein